MPDLEFLGLSMHRIVRDFVTLELNPQLNFLWPALQLSSEDLWEGNGHYRGQVVCAEPPGAHCQRCHGRPPGALLPGLAFCAGPQASG